MPRKYGCKYIIHTEKEIFKNTHVYPCMCVTTNEKETMDSKENNKEWVWF